MSQYLTGRGQNVGDIHCGKMMQQGYVCGYSAVSSPGSSLSAPPAVMALGHEGSLGSRAGASSKALPQSLGARSANLCA